MQGQVRASSSDTLTVLLTSDPLDMTEILTLPVGFPLSRTDSY